MGGVTHKFIYMLKSLNFINMGQTSLFIPTVIYYGIHLIKTILTNLENFCTNLLTNDFVKDRCTTDNIYWHLHW